MRVLVKLTLISLSMVCLMSTSYGQDASNFTSTVLQMSNTNPGGSARIRGLGGAQTALGGDISSAYSNPAGLGFFNRSEFSFTPNLNFINSSSTYLSTSAEDSRFNINIANLGVVINNTKSDIVAGKWRGGNFGISINRIADFNNSVLYEGFNFNPLNTDDELVFDINNPKDFIESAVLNTYLENNGDITFGNDFAELAYDIGLTDVFTDDLGEFVDRNIYAVDANGDYITDGDDNIIPAYPEPDFPVFQQESIKSSGGMYQTSFSYGGNYGDKLYFGAGVGIVTTSREIERTYIEEPSGTDLFRMRLFDYSELNGIGVNATFGFIGRPVNELLLGVSYTTPTLHAMEQVQELTLSAEFVDGESYESSIIYDPFSYTVTTPSKTNIGATYFFGKLGFITGELENVNYSGGRIKNGPDNFSFSSDNTNINRFESVWNARGGVEFRIDKFRVRGGAALLADPTDDELDQEQLQVTFGAGMRTKKFFIDFGVTNDLKDIENYISPYPGGDVALSSTNKTRVAITAGWFF